VKLKLFVPITVPLYETVTTVLTGAFDGAETVKFAPSIVEERNAFDCDPLVVVPSAASAT